MESLGYFWLPETPAKRFPGKLRFDPKEGGRLTLLVSLTEGGLIDFNDPGTHFRCVGEAGRKLYPLEDCFMTNFDGAEQSFYVNRLIEGMHFEKDEPFEFDGAVASVSELNDLYW